MLSRATIIEAFSHLSDELARLGVLGEISIVGGTAKVLAFNGRTSTKDVDAIFEPTPTIRMAAGRVAESLGLPADWLNDSAKGCMSPAGDFLPIDTVDFPNLRVQAPTPEYLLAMKVLASCVGVADERGDAADIAFLINHLALKDTSTVMEIVSRYYDPSRILPRSTYLVDEIIDGLRP